MAFNPIGASGYEKSAIHDFFIHITLPILVREGDKFGVIATGTLFKIAGRSFLITAAHTMETYKPANWHFPAHPRKGKIHSIGVAEYVKPSDSTLDVCIIELKDPNVIAVLNSNWRFLTLNNVWLPDLTADAVLLAGYPSARAVFEGENLQGRIFIVRQQFRDGVPPEVSNSSDPLTQGIDFFIDYQDAVNEYTRENIARVHIGGMSGCSVWAYREKGWARYTFWSAEVPLRVIGIQSAFVKNKYLRAKSWGGVFATLSRLDEDIRAEVRQFIERFIALTGYQPEA
jgi:hypothetical protein